MDTHVRTKDDLVRLIFNLLDDNDAVRWDNDTAYAYLQRLAEYLTDTDIATPSWQSIAAALIASKDRKP